MKIIHCNLWGDLEVSDLAVQIIDTPFFQRLHEIKQNGFAYRVFPTAKTSRFEHSLGVYFIIHALFKHVSCVPPVDPWTIELIAIAGLVHDIGHGPFSHWTDDVFLQEAHCLWSHHEQRSCDLFDHMVVQYNLPVAPAEVCRIQGWIRGESNGHWYDQLLHNRESGFDVDKLDYLLRDVRAFGFAYRFDPFRILRNIRIIDNRICFCEKIKDELLMMFLIRNKLREQIYRHPKIKQLERFIADSIPYSAYRRYLSILYERQWNAFLQWTDASLLSNLDPSVLYARSPFQQPQRHLTTRDSERKGEEDASKIMKEEKEEEDSEWKKLKNLYFYSRKNPLHAYQIPEQKWNLVSCFSSRSSSIFSSSL